MLVLYPVACLVSALLGGLRQCLALIVLGFCYNDLGFADRSCITRNLINGVGFVCYASGAVEVALGITLSFQQQAFMRWLAVISVVVFSTIQMMDMYDQEGDGLRGRKTVPLVMGDGLARWLTAAPMAFWSVFCPWYWELQPIPSAAFGVLGVAILTRTLTKRSVKDDKRTFWAWNIWMAFLYTLPLIKLLSRH
jgi:4-hydroxybenzoate polyprenyltransferase